MIPLNYTDTLEAFLSGAGTDKFIVIYYDVPVADKTDNSDYKRNRQITAANGATDVTICSAPPTGYTRHIEEIFYTTTGAITVTFQYDVSGTESPFMWPTLAANELFYYGPNPPHVL